MVTKKGHSISYNDKGIEKREENTEKWRHQRKRKTCESSSSTNNGLPNKQNDFILTT